MNLTPQELKQLKTEFDKLETYKSKLTFWEEHFLIQQGFEFFLNGGEGDRYLEPVIVNTNVFIDEKLNPENLISILPQNVTEISEFNHWLFHQIVERELSCNAEKLIENYYYTIKGNLLPVEFTEREISRIEKYRDNHKETHHVFTQAIPFGYSWGYDSVVNNKSTVSIPHVYAPDKILALAKGYADAVYLGFLKMQLEQLKQGKQVVRTIMVPLPYDNSKPQAEKSKFVNMWLEGIRHISDLDTLAKYLQNETLTAFKTFIDGNDKIEKQPPDKAYQSLKDLLNLKIRMYQQEYEATNSTIFYDAVKWSENWKTKYYSEKGTQPEKELTAIEKIQKEERIKYVLNNRELGAKKFPDEAKIVELYFEMMPDYQWANFYQSLPTDIPEWIKEAEQKIGLSRTKELQRIIDFIDTALRLEETNEIQQNALNGIKDELADYKIHILELLENGNINPSQEFVQPGTTYSTTTESNVNNFFEALRNGQLTKIETYNICEKLTDNFKLHKLKILLGDLELFINMEREEMNGSFTSEEINSACNKLLEKKKPLPFISIPKFEKDESGKLIWSKEETKILDLEKLMFPYEFFPCYEFGGFLKKEIKSKEKKSEDNSPNLVIEKPVTDTNHFCESMPLDKAKEHFKIFTEKQSKNGKPFLTMEQFNSFISRAFCSKTDIPKQKFNQAPKGEKLLIQTVFYEFYDRYCFEYFSTMQCQDNFIKLLTENFEGWQFRNVKDNFKPKTKKRL